MKIKAVVINIMALMGLILSISIPLQALGEDCSERLTSVWPPKDFRTLLNSIPDTFPRTLRGTFPVQVVGETPVEDYRIYQQMEWEGYLSKTYVNPEVERLCRNSEFKYLHSFYEGTAVFETRSGKVFSVPNFLRQDTSDVNKLLRGIESAVLRKQVDHRLDSYFRFHEILVAQKAGRDVRREFKEYLPPELPDFVSVSREELPIARTPVAGWVKILVKETRKWGDLYVTTIDTKFQESQRQPTDEDLARNRATQRKYLTEVAATLYPEYAGRRKWTREFVAQDFQKVLSTRDHTRYIITHKQTSFLDANSIVQIVGLNRALYNGVRYFNRQTQRWEERYFGVGAEESDGEGFVAKGSFLKRALTQPAHLLGMEKYLGIHLPRPFDVEVIVLPHSASMAEEDLAGVRAMGLDVDPSKPIYFGSGIIFEPVKFYGNSALMTKTSESELAISVLASMPYEFYRGASGQLFTFNPPHEGALLYWNRGFRDDPRFPVIQKSEDGSFWQVLSEDAIDFLAKFYSRGGKELEGRAHAFLKSVRESALHSSRKATSSVRAESHPIET